MPTVYAWCLCVYVCVCVCVVHHVIGVQQTYTTLETFIYICYIWDDDTLIYGIRNPTKFEVKKRISFADYIPLLLFLRWCSSRVPLMVQRMRSWCGLLSVRCNFAGVDEGRWGAQSIYYSYVKCVTRCAVSMLMRWQTIRHSLYMYIMLKCVIWVCCEISWVV